MFNPFNFFFDLKSFNKKSFEFLWVRKNKMPALAQDSILEKWKNDGVKNNEKERSLCSFENICNNKNGSNANDSSSDISSPLCASPIPKFGKTCALLPEASKSFIASSKAEDKFSKISSWFLHLIINLAQNILSKLFHLLWNQILIGPALWMSAWFWMFRKCVSPPLTILKLFLIFFKMRPANNYRKRVVLISGGSTVQALHLARNFYSAGARVIVCEIEGRFELSRFSTAVYKFYTVPKPDSSRAVSYVNALCSIVKKENVSYFIPVSATNEAFYDALAKPQLELLNCIVFCPTFKEILFFDDFFKVLSRCRAIGLMTPSHYYITSRDEIFQLYNSGLLRSSRHFMINVGSLGISQHIRIQMPPFPQDFRTSHEISHQKPWVIVQDLKGEHYITCTTVKEAFVVGNVTCLIGNDKKNLVPVEKEEIVSWIQTFFNKLKFRTISGHFSFRFVIPAAGESVILLGCKVGVSLPYICFTSVHPRIVWKPCKHFSRQSSGPLVLNRPRYWMHDAVLSAFRHPSVEALTKFVGTVLDKREALFVYWDPLPYCAFYYFQMPLKNFLNFVCGGNRQNRNVLHFVSFSNTSD